jgi:hypothetical protein
MAESNQMTAISDGVWANSRALDHFSKRGQSPRCPSARELVSSACGDALSKIILKFSAFGRFGF